MRILVVAVVLALLLAGCAETSDNHSGGLITESEALKVAQAKVQDSKATWSASFKEEEEIEINKEKEKRKVWIVEAKFPAGNKETYRIDATNGDILVLTETEVPGR